jgi:tryptophan-rich sensory protein
MKKYILPFIIMLFINFLGLYLGGLATNPGVQSDWYQNQIVQAPWKPPGFVFGIVWTLIGITWSVLGAWIWKNKKELLDIYAAGWVLNLAWNPIFFIFHATLTASIVISLLGVSIFYILESLRRSGNQKVSYWGYLYFFWLMIASSINWFITIMN